MPLKEKILGLIEEVNEKILAPISKSLGDIIDKIGLGVGSVSQHIQLYYGHFSLCHAKTIEHLDKLYKRLPKEVQEDEGIKEFYQERRKELETEGYFTPKDLILSPIAKGLASGVLHITNLSRAELSKWLEKYGKKYKIPEEDMEAIKELIGTGEVGLLIGGGIIGCIIYPLVSAFMTPPAEIIRQQSSILFRPTILTPIESIQSKWKELISDEKCKEILAKHGYSEKDMKVLEELIKYYPSPSDFIRFMVRETFKEDVVKRYGYDEGYPKEIEEYVKKAGVDPEWMKHYWRAHWENISPTMAYEMLHRGLITKEDVETILRIADYPPYFVPKMVEIAYAPFTRVDVRRMYKLGILDKEGVKRAYMDIGYDEKRAEQLTEFTIKYETEEDRDLSKEEIVKLYTNDFITKEECTEMLKAIGYEDREVDFIIALADLRTKEEEVREKITVIRESFLLGVIDEDEMISQLDTLNLPAYLREKEVIRAKRMKQKQIKMPTKEEILRWYNQGLISEDKAIEILSNLNIPTKFIPLYLGKKGE